MKTLEHFDEHYGIAAVPSAGEIASAILLERSKLPPAEPVALIRHKWPATSCGKPLRNASHRVF